jgi:hypothetical protein
LFPCIVFLVLCRCVSPLGNFWKKVERLTADLLLSLSLSLRKEEEKEGFLRRSFPSLPNLDRKVWETLRVSLPLGSLLLTEEMFFRLGAWCMLLCYMAQPTKERRVISHFHTT